MYRDTCSRLSCAGNSFPVFTLENEAKRQAVNAWIRTSGEYDAVIDFDRVLRDPDAPARILPLYDSGDHGHPTDAGYRALGDSINLGLFSDMTSGDPGERVGWPARLGLSTVP